MSAASPAFERHVAPTIHVSPASESVSTAVVPQAHSHRERFAGLYHPQGTKYVHNGALKSGVTPVYDPLRVATFEAPLQWHVGDSYHVNHGETRPRHASSSKSSSSSSSSSSSDYRPRSGSRVTSSLLPQTQQFRGCCGGKRCCGSPCGTVGGKRCKCGSRPCCMENTCSGRRQHHYLSEGTHNHRKTRCC